MGDDRREQTRNQILEHRVSAILRTNNTEVAEAAMQAAVDGGIQVIEFTLTTPGAFELIEKFAADDSLLVGAGTVLTAEEAQRAVNVGARFLVSPICDPAIIKEADRLGVVSVPGTATPTEMVNAHRAGADFVKLFPASGDVAETVTSILGPLPFLRIFPTSGVTVQNFAGILKAGAAGVGFVRSLFQPANLEARHYAAIKNRAADIIQRLSALGV